MTPVYITFTLYLILVLGIGFAAYFAEKICKNPSLWFFEQHLETN